MAKVACCSAPLPLLEPLVLAPGGGTPPAASKPLRLLTHGEDSAWPPLALPRLQVDLKVDDDPAELCIIRRSPVVMDLERHL